MYANTSNDIKRRISSTPLSAASNFSFGLEFLDLIEDECI